MHFLSFTFPSNKSSSLKLMGTRHIADMTNQQLLDHGNNMMDETDQAIDRAKKVSKFECIICYVG